MINRSFVLFTQYYEYLSLLNIYKTFLLPNVNYNQHILTCKIEIEIEIEINTTYLANIIQMYQ